MYDDRKVHLENLAIDALAVTFDLREHLSSRARKLITSVHHFDGQLEHAFGIIFLDPASFLAPWSSLTNHAARTHIQESAERSVLAEVFSGEQKP